MSIHPSFNVQPSVVATRFACCFFSHKDVDKWPTSKLKNLLSTKTKGCEFFCLFCANSSFLWPRILFCFLWLHSFPSKLQSLSQRHARSVRILSIGGKAEMWIMKKDKSLNWTQINFDSCLLVYVSGTVCAASSTMTRSSPIRASLMWSSDSSRQSIWWKRLFSSRRV